MRSVIHGVLDFAAQTWELLVAVVVGIVAVTWSLIAVSPWPAVVSIIVTVAANVLFFWRTRDRWRRY